jgi:hypothetical protein
MKWLPPESHHREIRHEPGLAAVAIREWVYLDQPVMEAYSDLIVWVCVAYNPRFRLIQQLPQGRGRAIQNALWGRNRS